MIHLLAEHLSQNISRRLKYSELKQQWLRYGLESALSQVFSFSLIFIIAIFLKVVFEVLIFTVVFLLLRKRAGGFHFENDLLCSAVSIVLCFSSVFLAKLIAHTSDFAVGISLLVAFIAEIVIIFLAPIRHPKLHLTRPETLKLKKNTRIVCVVISALLLIAFVLPVPSEYIAVANAAIISVAVLTIFAKLLKQEEKSNEQEELEHELGAGPGGTENH